jgi:hypothetical protein
MLARHSYFAYDGVQNERCGTGTWFVNRVSPSCAQARRLLSVLKVIARREGGRRLWKSRSDFQGAVGAFSASMAPAASRALQARQSSWQRPRRLPLGCRTHPGLAASLPPPRAALRTPRGRPRNLSHARLRPHHLALPKEGDLKRTLRSFSQSS